MSHTVPVQPTTAHAGPPPSVPGIRLWQAAGVLALAHVALVITGIALMRSPLFQDGTAGIERGYVEGDMARTMAGGMLEVLGFVVLIPALVFLARAIGRRTEIGGWAAQTALMGGMAYIAVTMAVGFPAGAAALYSAQHGLDVDTVFAINNIRNFGYFLSLALLGAHAIGLAIAAWQDRIMTRWVGVGGLLTGVVLFASVPAAAVGQQDWGTLAWTVWWIGVGVGLLRHRPGPT
ncbi:hypothetical protein BH20ACT6_BH20ACT6_24490 [soil metagenome]